MRALDTATLKYISIVSIREDSYPLNSSFAILLP